MKLENNTISKEWEKSLFLAIPEINECEPKTTTDDGQQSSTSGYEEEYQPKNNYLSQKSNARYKTELCHQFLELGDCQYGLRCVYAHGIHEINRKVNRHPNYKTRICTAYQFHGYCSFGPRCSFIHSRSDPIELLESMKKTYPKLPMPENPVPNRRYYEFYPSDSLYRKTDHQMIDEMILMPSVFVNDSYERLPFFKSLTGH